MMSTRRSVLRQLLAQIREINSGGRGLIAIDGHGTRRVVDLIPSTVTPTAHDLPHTGACRLCLTIFAMTAPTAQPTATRNGTPTTTASTIMMNGCWNMFAKIFTAANVTMLMARKSPAVFTSRAGSVPGRSRTFDVLIADHLRS